MTDEEKISEVGCSCDDIHSDAIERAKHIIPDDTKLYDCADFFKVFSDSTRMKILWSLDAGEMCVCDIAEILGMTKSAVSHQLNILRREKLVKNRKAGKNVFYSLDDDHVKDILEKGLEHILER